MWILQQIWAVFIKKMTIARRDRRFVLFGLIFPILASVGVVIVKHQLTPDNHSFSYHNIFIPSSYFSPSSSSSSSSFSSIIPYLSPPGVDPSFLFPYFPPGFNFTKFNSVDDLNLALLDNTTTVYTNIIGGYNFENITSTTYSVSVWYNDSYPRILPALTKTLSQAIYAYQSNATIKINETAVELPSYTPGFVSVGLIAPMILQYGIMFLLPYFAITLVIEKEKQLKDMLMLNSLSRPAYWIGTWLGDTICFWIPNLLSLIIMWAFKVDLFTGSNAGPALFIYLLTGWAGIPFVYLLSFIFDKEETANRWIYSTISFFSIIPIVFSTIWGNKHADKIDYLSFIPPYGYFRALTDLASDASIFLPCIIMFIDGIAYITIAMLIDYKVFSRLVSTKTPFYTRQPEDEDVVRERESLSDSSVSHHDDAITVKEVVKSYDQKFVAVKGVSFRVKSGECFGLLGPNGAGKTSILNVMYGAAKADSGQVKMDHGNEMKIQGVCPQFDVLWDLMTGKEHLYVYGRIKGIYGKELESTVAESLELFGLNEYADQNTVGYSGGTKRKLCSAIALLGNPHVVFMDEPSTGMDPVTRRLMWNVIEQKKHGRALILTTHSMEEAEALCTRVGIMVKGQLRCIGSPQHLRNRYGSGYRLTINTAPENAERVQQWVNAHYTAHTQMAVAGMLTFDLKQSTFELHKIFMELEQNRNELGLDDYCLSQTSLEQVFLRFALEQEDETMDQ